MNSSPLVSIILPVYNGERFLREAVQSILDQSYKNFELLIIDDGSTDGSVTLIKSFQDPRIRLIKNPTNQGLPKTLNIGIQEAKGEYIARMDSDDIAMPDRLEKQVAYLNAHPEIGLLGTWAELIDENGQHQGWNRPPTSHASLKWRSLSANPLIHPAIMARAEMLKAHLYNESYRNSQDFELWSRLLFTTDTKTANLPEVLLKQRLNHTSITKTKSDDAKRRSAHLPIANLERYTPLSVDDLRILFLKGTRQKLTIKELWRIRKLYHQAAEAFIQREPMTSDDVGYLRQQLHGNNWFLVKYWIRHLG